LFEKIRRKKKVVFHWGRGLLVSKRKKKERDRMNHLKGKKVQEPIGKTGPVGGWRLKLAKGGKAPISGRGGKFLFCPGTGGVDRSIEKKKGGVRDGAERAGQRKEGFHDCGKEEDL